MEKCRIAGTKLNEVFSLGELYVSDFLSIEKDSSNCSKNYLTVCFNE